MSASILPNGGVVGTLMSNLGLELALQELQIPFARAKVGDRYVMAELQSAKLAIGWRRLRASRLLPAYHHRRRDHFRAAGAHGAQVREQKLCSRRVRG